MDIGSVASAVVLGLVEGLTEFIPVSSTGHLILGAELLGFRGEGSAAFKIAIQLGAILAVLLVYRQRFAAVAVGLLRRDADAALFTRNILLGFLPAVLVGAVAYSAIRRFLENPPLVAWALLIGGILALARLRIVRPAPAQSVEAMPARTAALIGVMQCLAMVPGVSRSGATILGALLMGVDRRTATEFSFFLAVPTMAAATVYALWKERAALSFDQSGLIAIGFVVAFLAALLVVRSLVGFVARHGFAPFAWYRIAVGGGALLWLWLR
jgi:undecaprenyl-diphosphatase